MLQILRNTSTRSLSVLHIVVYLGRGRGGHEMLQIMRGISRFA